MVCKFPKFGYVTLIMPLYMTRATPLSGMVGRPKANTCYSLQAHKI